MQESPSPELSPIPDAVVEATAIVVDVKTSPFHPRNLFDLYFRPRRFFQHVHLMQHKNYLYLAAWIYGMSSVIDRVDQIISNPNDNLRSLALESLGHSWPIFWLVVALFGAFSALLIWIISGFWYWLRIRWSGHHEPDGFIGRQIFFYSGLISALPVILLNIILSIVYHDYATAYGVYQIPGYSETSPLVDLIAVSLIIFPFWSVIASYIGVRTCFSTVKWKAILWFVALPMAIYLIGIVAVVVSALI